MVYILIERAYEKNSRIKLILDGVFSVVKKKRLSIKIYKDVSQIDENVSEIILICASLKWSTDTIKQLNERNIHPILFGFQYTINMFRYSCVSFTYTKSSYQLANYVLNTTPGKCAFLGYNEDSLPDKLKFMGFQYAMNEKNVEYNVFKSYGDSLKCLQEFSNNCEDIKNIFCCNDGIALLLQSSFPELLKDRTLCCCSGMKVSEYVEHPYPTAKINYFKAGEQLALLYVFISKNEGANSMSITLDMDVFINGQEPCQYKGDYYNSIMFSNESVDFYGDENIVEIENLEQMFLSCDELDIQILKELYVGKSYEQIAELLYLAPNTVKYRVHSMYKNAGLESKKHLFSTLGKYGIKF